MVALLAAVRHWSGHGARAQLYTSCASRRAVAPVAPLAQLAVHRASMIVAFAIFAERITYRATVQRWLRYGTRA